jgi:hypothetical protein
VGSVKKFLQSEWNLKVYEVFGPDHNPKLRRRNMHLDLAKALGLTGFTLSTVVVVAILLL